jgi:hypothetical protein
MNLPAITKKQQELLRLIYRYRFLQRNQLQAFMHHKDKKRSSSWLKDLRDKQYLSWLYAPDDPIEKTKPAVYYMGINGIRFLRALNEYPPEELRKRYKEATRQQPFIDRCLLLANCCLNLEANSKGNKHYSYMTESDYVNPESDYNFISELKPHLCFEKTVANQTTNYLLEVFDNSLPRYRVKKRLKDYVDYLYSGDWEYEMGSQLPIVLLICPATAELIYVKRRIRTLSEEGQIDEDMHIRVATVEQVKRQGVTAIIWEEP